MEFLHSKLLLLLVLACLGCSCLSVNVSDVSGFTKLRSWKQSTLYRIESDAGYETNPLLLQLVGSRYGDRLAYHNMGYAYGYLLNKEISDAYFALLKSLLGGSNLLDEGLMMVIGMALDWQWQDYLSKELPVIYKRELSGVADGAAAQGCTDCGSYVTRAITLANAPGDTRDFILVIVREFLKTSGDSSPQVMKLLSALKSPKHSMHCSMFAVWGDRTLNGELFSARNLDWNKNTGINRNKLVMVTVPNDGGIPSANLGFVGVYGTLAGMSAAGLTLHEANLEELQISFRGFPWTLRVRFIMEFAKDLTSARQLWDSTNNTVGFNHMIASAPDAALYRKNKTRTVALALETMYQYTAYFADNDTREAAAEYAPNDGSPTVHIGFPLHEAVWRTNHGYDPKIRENYEWSQDPGAYSIRRYMLIHDSLLYYHSHLGAFGYMEALNMTAIVGDKGSEHPHQCLNNTDGSNVLSVTFLPEHQTLYSAWEKSSGDKWRPAVCCNYIKLNMTDWFTIKT